MKRIVRNMLIGFIAVSALLTTIATLTYINMSDLVNREYENTKSLRILRVIEDIQFNSLDIESGMRGFLIVGDTSYLRPYKNGKGKLGFNIELLIQYTEGNNSFHNDAKELKQYAHNLMEVASILVKDEYTYNTDTTKRIRMLYQTKRYMDGIRKITNDIETKERIVLQQTNLKNINKARLTKFGYFATALLAIVILIIVFFIIRNELHKRKIAEEKLLESSNRIFDLYNNAPCGYHSVGNNNLILAMNDTELKWLGYTREEVVGVKTIFDIIHEKDHYKIQDFIDEVIKNKVNSIKDLELCYIKKDGSTFEVMLNSTVNYDKNGKSLSTRTVVLDITDLKKSQAKINTLYTELEENNKQLKDANSELESFSYSVSHDLRAPLRAIDGYCRIILEDYEKEMDEEAKRIFGVILSNSKRMGQLIDDLLDFSRLGRKLTNAVLVDHQKVIDEVIAELTVNEKVTFTIDYLDLTMVDRTLIKQVWFNLISNAIKYSSKISKPLIHIFSYTNTKEIIYCIEDNGVGFDEAYKHKLFNVFQRLHHEDEYEGTGVGLAIVYKIISKHNGRVWAESEPLKSTKFYFSIPIL